MTNQPIFYEFSDLDHKISSLALCESKSGCVFQSNLGHIESTYQLPFTQIHRSKGKV